MIKSNPMQVKGLPVIQPPLMESFFYATYCARHGTYQERPCTCPERGSSQSCRADGLLWNSPCNVTEKQTKCASHLMTNIKALGYFFLIYIKFYLLGQRQEPCMQQFSEINVCSLGTRLLLCVGVAVSRGQGLCSSGSASLRTPDDHGLLAHGPPRFFGNLV